MGRKKKLVSKKNIRLIAVLITALIAFYIGITNNKLEIPKYENVVTSGEKLNVFYLDVGQADSTFITINGYNMLIDAGNQNDGEYIANFLRQQGVTKIDYVIGTHTDEDHIGGMFIIIDEFDVGKFYIPNTDARETKAYRYLLEILEKKKVEKSTIEPSNEIKYTLNNAFWKALYVDNTGNVENANDTSIIIQLEYGKTKYLFMGDASSAIESKLMEQNVLQQIDVLKVGHHGSSSSSSTEFLSIVNPTYAVISVGDNEYGHPTASVLKRLTEIGAKIHRTDTEGTILITSDGNSIQVTTLDYNMDGNRQPISLIENKKRYFKIEVSYLLSTI